MKVDVALFNGPEQPLSYCWPSIIPSGTRVRVPLGSRVALGIVVSGEEEGKRDLKEVLEIVDETPLLSPMLLQLTKWAAAYYLEPWAFFLKASLPPDLRKGRATTEIAERWVLLRETLGRASDKLTKRQKELVNILKSGGLPLREVVNRGFSRGVIKRLMERDVLKLEERSGERIPFELASSQSFLTLTADQERAFEKVKASLGDFAAFLLFGITGSGKTELYLHWGRECLNKGMGLLMLIPEISLTPQYIKRFTSRFGSSVAVLHSGLTGRERTEEWLRVKRGAAPILLGTRSAIFAPLKNLGLIIVDEEHDISFKQENAPRYNARDLAVVRANMEGCPVILASATPSLESYYNALKKKYTLIELKERVRGSLPKVKVVNMTQEIGIFSASFLRTLKETLARGRQALILLNRRGYSLFLICKGCGETLRCPNCDITLTLHRAPRTLRCHYCGYSQRPPDYCPSCSAEMEAVGIGIQQVEEDLVKLLPSVRIERMDRDRIRAKAGHWQILQKLEEGEIKVLLGTQMVAKGHHYPGIHLVCVILADQGLHIPDFRSAERTFQLITQVMGRAGRVAEGKAIIQTYMPQHYAIKFAAKQDYVAFAQEELRRREKMDYPPFAYMARVLLTGVKREKVEERTKELFSVLFKKRGLTLLGPSPAPLTRLKNRYRWHILVKGKRRKDLLLLLSQLPRKIGSVRVQVDIDPYQLL